MSTIRDHVQAEIQRKITAGEELEQRVAAAEEAHRAAEEAHRLVAGARREALSAGWSERELRALGLAESRPRGRRPRGGARSSSASTPTSAQEQTNDDAGIDADESDAQSTPAVDDSAMHRTPFAA